MLSPWLTDDEVSDLCDGLVQPAAQVRYLVGMGFTVKTKPNGRPLVGRSHVESVLCGPAMASGQKRVGIDKAALLQVVKGGRGGTT